MFVKNLIYPFALVLLLLGFLSCQMSGTENDAHASIPNPKNVILFIGDGMGYNQVLAANYYQHGRSGVQVYEQDDWQSMAIATYPAVVSLTDADTVFAAGYNPRKAWSDALYLSDDATGSAEAATAMSTGKKTYSRSIGLGIYGDTLTHISHVAKTLGKSVGVVTSVQICHATPAGFAAHNKLRYNYGEITSYMLFNTQLDLIMGAGNPDFDDNGLAVDGDTRYIGSRELWDQLKANDGRSKFLVDGDTLEVLDANGDGQADPWTLIQDREDFLTLAEGTTPSRVLGIPKVATTLHYNRDGFENQLPDEQALNPSVPRLEELTRASLNVLGKNPKGFFVMIEGGAIDWAGHDNHLGRMIEEQIGFNQAVEAAVRWVEEHSSWDETLIVVTSDHETGYLTGPDHPESVNAPVKNVAKGEIPASKWNSTNHTNSLVPFYAKGKGSEIFQLFADETDPVRGPFIQNSEIPQALFLMWGK